MKSDLRISKSPQRCLRSARELIRISIRISFCPSPPPVSVVRGPWSVSCGCHSHCAKCSVLRMVFPVLAEATTPVSLYSSGEADPCPPQSNIIIWHQNNIPNAPISDYVPCENTFSISPCRFVHHKAQRPKTSQQININDRPHAVLPLLIVSLLRHAAPLLPCISVHSD